MDSFVSLLWPHDPYLWKDHLAPEGTLEKSLLEDFKGPLPSYLTEEDKQHFITTFRANGFASPTCMYKIMVNKMAALDDQRMSLMRHTDTAF